MSHQAARRGTTLVVAGTALWLFCGVMAVAHAQDIPLPFPDTTTPPSSVPVDAPPLPLPSTAPPAPPAAPAPPPDGNEAQEHGWIQEFLTGWFWGFFENIATSGLNAVLDWLAHSLLATPALHKLPVVGQIWGGSQRIMLACSGLLITLAGLSAIAYQTLHTRASVKEILPRIAVAFTAANMSLFFGGKAIEFANALSVAVLVGDPGKAAETAAEFTNTLRGRLPQGEGQLSELYVIFTVLVLVVMIIAVLLTYVVRVALTVLLLIAAPLMLMCHALPHTEAVAYWWWRCFGGVLAVQVAQSLAFVAIIRLFFLPGGVTLF